MNFLLTSAAKTFSLTAIAKMSDEKVEELLKGLRWPETEGRPVCPECGCDAVYVLKTRSQYRCKRCGHTFSLTSGTLFHSSKLSLRTILQIGLLWANAAKGKSALEIRRDIGLNHKSSFVILHKLREALFKNRDVTPMTGSVEADGMHVGGAIRHANLAVDRPEQNTKPTPRLCVIALCQRNPAHGGALRTLVRVVETERAAAIIDFVGEHVVQGSTVYADEHAGYDRLAAWFDLRRVNHKRGYRGDGGENINLCENLFSRFRRLQFGQIHKVEPRYLEVYANEIAYRIDTCRWDNKRITSDILGKALRTGRSESWRGYWRAKAGPDVGPLQAAA